MLESSKDPNFQLLKAFVRVSLTRNPFALGKTLTFSATSVYLFIFLQAVTSTNGFTHIHTHNYTVYFYAFITQFICDTNGQRENIFKKKIYIRNEIMQQIIDELIKNTKNK